MARNGGHSFYRSLPTMLAMSLPYSSLMMASNETIRWYLNLSVSGSYSLTTFLLAGAASGSFAAVATTPLDVIKTKLNTQGLEMARTSTGELHALLDTERGLASVLSSAPRPVVRLPTAHLPAVRLPLNWRQIRTLLPLLLRQRRPPPQRRPLCRCCCRVTPCPSGAARSVVSYPLLCSVPPPAQRGR